MIYIVTRKPVASHLAWCDGAIQRITTGPPGPLPSGTGNDMLLYYNELQNRSHPSLSILSSRFSSHGSWTITIVP
jgi:hypothetical protein